MKRITSLILYLLTLGALLAGCTNGDEPDPEPVPEYPREASRSVLVYMVANNNLGNSYSRYDARDMAEMQRAMDSITTLDGELLVFHAPYQDTPVLLRMRPNMDPDTLVVYSEADFKCLTESGMKRVLNDSRDFVHTSEHGLVLWSHGTGWIQDGVEPARSSMRSYGMDGDMKMNVTSLAAVLESGYDFDWLYFDCCFMNSVEVAYELRRAVPLIVGSATELPAEGMPYQHNISEFLHPGGSDPVAAGRNTFAYFDAMAGVDRTCTMSAIRTAGMDRVAAAVGAIYAAADPKLPVNYAPQRFENVSMSTCRYYDLGNYLKALCLTDDGEERFEGAAAAYAEFEGAMDEAIIYKAATPKLWNSLPLTYHCGLSTYILRDAASASYKNYDTLSWYADVASKLNF